MRRYFLLFLGLAITLPVAAKQARGRVVDTSGEAISYVNIGVPGTTTGTVSRRDGTFTLDIPDSLASQALSFHHVSYRPMELLPASDMRVELQEAAYEAEQIVVRPGKARHKRLTGAGIRIGFTTMSSDSTSQHPGSDLGAEFGTLVKVEHDFQVGQVRLSIAECTDTAWVLRFNIYRVENEQFTNLIRKPVYFRFPLTKSEMTFDTAIEPPVFLSPGSYFVALEFVEVGADRSLYFPAFLRSSYIRNSSMGRWIKTPVNLGLSVSGVEYR